MWPYPMYHTSTLLCQSPVDRFSVRMSAGVEETAEAVPEVGLAVGQVGQVVVAVEAAVALPMTGYRYLGVHHHL